MLHASAVVVDGDAYLFSAPCGTGKSTHASLWLKYLKHKNPYILNDDKPAIRIVNDNIYVYGTPFSGKTDKNKNEKANLKGIAFLEQSNNNDIKLVSTAKAIELFLWQTMRKLNKKEMKNLLDVVEQIVLKVPIYKLKCNMSEEAVNLSYNTMKEYNKI